MRINLTDGYWITADNYNYTLMQDYTGIGKDKTPKGMTRTVGHYSNGIKGLKGCIKRYLEECSLDAPKPIQIDFENFCDHLEKTIEVNTDWIVSHIGDLVQKTYKEEQEMKAVRNKCGDY